MLGVGAKGAVLLVVYSAFLSLSLSFVGVGGQGRTEVAVLRGAGL